MKFILLFSVFVIATCGLVYELIAGALASYLLGDSVTQFSLVIGVYLFSMGIGSYLSKFVKRNIAGVFIRVEILVGFLGGCSAAVLFLLFEHVQHFRLVLFGQIALIGTLVGLEIPLVMRLLKEQFEFKDLVSQVFTFDYIGALLASVLFPLVLVPHLGLVRSAFLFGILNTAVALWAILLFREQFRSAAMYRFSAVAVILFLGAGFAFAERILGMAETAAYTDEIIYSKSSPYQRVVLTRGHKDFRLFLNGNLQFSSRDEYRYHEALVLPGLLGSPRAEKVLILGGGDGLAAREVLKHGNPREILLVDLDPTVTDLFRNHPVLVDLSERSLLSPKVKVLNQDAFIWIQSTTEQFDLVIIDFPDPSNFSLGKLYSTHFYKHLHRILSPRGLAVVQSTSPYYARKSYWTVEATLRAEGFQTLPYHAHVPSFGEWGFILVGKQEIPEPRSFPKDAQYFSRDIWSQMKSFPSDMGRVPAPVNRLNNQVLVRTFEEEWAGVSH